MARDAKTAAADTPTLTNRKAFHEFEILERYVCGIVLAGPEVKSLRLGRASLDEAYARLKNGEMWLIGQSVPEPATWIAALAGLGALAQDPERMIRMRHAALEHARGAFGMERFRERYRDLLMSPAGPH